MYHNERESGRQDPRGTLDDLVGRVAQKRRTRNDLIRAARLLRERGEIPTVAQAADAAGVSRATAYRYFPSQESLLAETSAAPLLDAVQAVLQRCWEITDVEARVHAAFSGVVPIMLVHAAELRTMLKISLERALQFDDEREVPLISQRWLFLWDPLLEPIRSLVSPQRYVLMVRSLSTLLSSESLMVFRDALDGDDAQTIEAICEAALAMTRGFLSMLDGAHDVKR